MSSQKVSRIGYLYALGSAVTGGLIPIFGKLLVGSVEPLTVSALTFLVAGLILLPVNRKERPTKRSVPWMVASGLLGAALAPALYLIGIAQTTAVSAALLANAEVFLTGVIAYVVLRERLKREQLLESILVVVGIVVVTTGLDLSKVQLIGGLAGNLLILGASLVWAVDNNLSRITSQMFGPTFVSKFRNIFGGAMLLAVLLLASYPVGVPMSALPLLFFYAVDIALATLTFMGALVRIGVVRTLIVFSTTSIFGSLFAVVALGEGVTLIQVSGGALILLGVLLIERSEGE